MPEISWNYRDTPLSPEISPLLRRRNQAWEVSRGIVNPEDDDGRGILYSQYTPSIQEDKIPKIHSGWLPEVLQYLEQRAPRNIRDVLEQIDIMLQSHMKYDAIHYFLWMSVDRRGDNYILSVDEAKVWLNQKQLAILRTFIRKMRAEAFVDAWVFSNNREIALASLDGIDPSVAMALASSNQYTRQHHASYNIPIGTLLKEGVGQCRVFSAVAKMILSEGAVRWNLPLAKIEYMDSPSGDHTMLRLTLKDWTNISYDPTRNFLIQKTPQSLLAYEETEMISERRGR